MLSKNRPSKFVDILMREKDYSIHLDRLSKIHKNSKTSRTTRIKDNISSLEQYLKQFEEHKDHIKQRRFQEIQQQNQQIVQRLIDITRPNFRYSSPEPKQKHFHSYFRSKEIDRERRSSNLEMVKRLLSTESLVPSRKSLRKQHKQNKKYKNNIKKFPLFESYQKQAKRRISNSKN